MSKTFDRSAEDVGNILALEHLNLTVPDQPLAALFYVSGLGFTRDPYVDFGVFNFNNMWVNVGDQQFHLPQGNAQRFRGTIGLVVPDLEQLRWRLDQVGRSLKDTQFGWEVYDDYIGVTCPWGNRIRCHAANERCHSASAISTWMCPPEPPRPSRVSIAMSLPRLPPKLTV